jgi:hypothetical protein
MESASCLDKVCGAGWVCDRCYRNLRRVELEKPTVRRTLGVRDDRVHYVNREIFGQHCQV